MSPTTETRWAVGPAPRIPGDESARLRRCLICEQKFVVDSATTEVAACSACLARLVETSMTKALETEPAEFESVRSYDLALWLRPRTGRAQKEAYSMASGWVEGKLGREPDPNYGGDWQRIGEVLAAHAADLAGPTADRETL